MQCAQNFRQLLQVVVIRGGLRRRLPRILRRLPPILRGRAARFSGGRRRQRRASNIRGSQKEKNAWADRHRQKTTNSAMGPEHNLIGNSGHNCRIYNRAAQQRVSRRNVRTVSSGRTISNGLVTACSYCGLTSSSIGQCICCASPEWPVGRKTRPRHHHPSGPLFFPDGKRGVGETAKRCSLVRKFELAWGAIY